MSIEAVFEKGVFRPLEKVPDLGEGSHVLLLVHKPLDRRRLRELAGSISPEDAREMMRIVTEGRRVEGEW